MPAANRGHRRSGTVLAAVILAGSACASNPPPSPAGALSVQGVFDCGLNVMEADGWEVATGPGGPRIAGEREPEYLIVLLQRGEQQVALDVRRSDKGGIAVDFRTGYAGPRVVADQLKQRIMGRCMS